MLYKAKNQAIKFYDDYSLMMSDAKYKAKPNETKGTRYIIKTNASKITDSSCTSKIRQ